MHLGSDAQHEILAYVGAAPAELTCSTKLTEWRYRVLLRNGVKVDTSRSSNSLDNMFPNFEFRWDPLAGTTWSWYRF